MYDFIIYSLKAGACLAVFYLFFKLLLSRETFHRLNRILVLGAIVLSLVLPLCVITIYREIPTMPEMPLEGEYFAPAPASAPAPAPQSETFQWEILAGAVFFGGILAMLLWTLISLLGVLRLVRRGKHERIDDKTVLVRLEQAVTPFSWGRYVVVSEADLAENGEAIMRHERAHLALRHSVDLLLTDLAGCLQWFNPAMWLLRRELRAIHEYEADKAVLASGIDARQYQLLLIKKAAGGRWYSVANSFNHSKLKNRITMMLQKKSSRWAVARTLFLLPLTLVALGAFARTAYVTPDDKVKKETRTIRISGTDVITSDDSKLLMFVDGVEVETIKDIKNERIKEFSILKGQQAIEKYGDKAADGVVEITMKKDSEPDGPMTVKAQTDKETKTVVVKKDSGETSYKIISDGDGRDVLKLQGDPVLVVGSSSRVVTNADGKVKVVTMRDEVDADVLAQVVRAGVESANGGLEIARKGVEFARKAVEMAKDQMTDEEWREAQAELAKAEKEIAEEMAKTRTEVRIVTSDSMSAGTAGKVVRVNKQVNKQNAEMSDRKVISTHSTNVQTFENGEKPLFVIDGKVVSEKKFKELDSETVTGVNMLKGEPAIEKYGKKAKYGALEITTKK